jgi:hypothetical protein
VKINQGYGIIESTDKGTNMLNKKSFDEIYKAILAILPTAQLGEDNAGQLVVYTDLYPDVESPDGKYANFDDLGEVQRRMIEDGEHLDIGGASQG